jgi:hypothetical protein
MKTPALIALLVLLPLTANAEIYKCVANGHTTFQDSPCAGGNSETVNTNNLTIISAPPIASSSEASLSVMPVRPRIYFPRPNQHQSAIERRNSRVKLRAHYPLRRGW